MAAHLCSEMKTALLACGILGVLGLHDFFVSILTIRHDPVAKTLDLTWRMTAHDVEHVFASEAELKLGSAKEHPKADSLLNAYFIKHLILMRDKQLVWKWIGKELDGETLYCYLQVEGVASANDLMVQNTLLQDVFGDQQNMVHLEEAGKPTLSHTFIRGSSPHTFTWK